MEGVASEVSLKIRSAIKAKLVELGTYVDEELPDYIMVLVANKKTKDQMDDDLSLFLGHNTERFTSWLHHVLQKLNAAALLQVTTPQEEVKRKDPEEEKRKEKEEEKRREREEEKKRLKLEETRKLKEEEKRKAKEKEKTERKRKSSERKSTEKKEKKLKKSESPTLPEKTAKDKRVVSEVVKSIKIKEVPKEKEKEKEKAKPLPPREEPPTNEKNTPTAAEVAPVQSSLDVSLKKIKPLVRGKISSADIFRAESQAEQKKEEEEEELEEDLLVLRADVDELGLELEDEPTPKKGKEQLHRAFQLRAEGKQESKAESKVASKADTKEKADHQGKTETRDKTDYKERTKPKSEPAVPRISAKERLGGIVAPRTGTSRDKPSVLDRLGSSTGGKHMINLREESGGPVRSESSSGVHNQGVARVVSSAITSAHRSVCVLPPSNSSGKKLEARVRPLMSRQIESSHVGVSRVSGENTSVSSEERVRESVSRPSGRVVSAVGAVLKRSHTQADSDDEEYDPKKPGLSGVASKVEVTPRPRRPRAIQANTALILRAMADAHKSVNRPSHHSKEREKVEKQKSRKKHKGELFSRSYRQREEAAKEKDNSDTHLKTQEPVTIRKIAITVPNATHKESEKQVKQEKKKEEEKEKPMEEEEDDEEDEVKVEVSVAMRPHVPEVQMEVSRKEPKEDAMEIDEEDKAQVSDNDYGMEEVEEVEEEVVDEGIEEDQPPIQHPLPSAIMASGANTKFIVTLEGVDNEVFPEKEEPLTIRSRLGMRPPPADTEDQVEEYIEEVEEWEEEEEIPEELSVTSGVPVGGLVTGVKARLKAATNPALPLQPGSSKERCKYWPLCKAGESCIYHHPTVTCKSFPACKFGDKCLFIHPNCMYDAACTRMACPYTHASSRNFAGGSVAAQKHKAAPPTRTAKVKCKFFPKCTNLSCPFLHPKACYYGAACKQANCPFTHPAVPMGAKLKWIAPKISSSQTTCSNTTITITADSKEIGKKEETLINK